MRIVEVITKAELKKELRGMAKFYGAVDHWWGPEDEHGRVSLRMLVPDETRQELTDALQSVLSPDKQAHIVISSVDAVLPQVEPSSDEASEARRQRKVRATREELYQEIAKGSELDGNFLLLVVLSTVVAAIGLAEDNVAVVIGAMVIAPLLGPNIAFAFATSLGDKALSLKSLRTNLVGLGLALSLSVLIGVIWDLDQCSRELMSRTDVGLDAVALALASGAAAVLSLTTGVSSTLVGVMVAVALLPPTATMGIAIGAGHPQLALGAALLLTVNLVCVQLSAKTVFYLNGVKPRAWLERARARQSTATYILVWSLLLAILMGLILVRGSIMGSAASQGSCPTNAPVAIGRGADSRNEAAGCICAV